MHRTEPGETSAPAAVAHEVIEDPLFLVGAERSGTTLLRLMLDHHPRVAFLPEFEYSVEWLTAEGQWPPVDRYIDWLRMNRLLEEPGLSVRRRDSYPLLVDDFLRQKRERDGKEHVGATVHRQFDRLLWIWPGARFVHLVRDPRDVARSSIRMGWAGDTYTALDRWLHAERLWDGVCEKVAEERRCEVSYERLITEPDDELRRLCAFIGVPFDAGMYSYAETSTYDSPDGSLIQQWRQKLSEREIRLAESRLGPWLERRGYQASGLPPLPVGPVRRLCLRTRSKWSSRLHRLRKFGLPLTVADVLTRRLPGQPFRRSVQSRMYEISRRSWK